MRYAMFVKHPALAVAALLTAVVLANPARAQLAVTRTPATAPDLGRVIQGSSTTVFSIGVDGVVTRTSGNAIRISNTALTPPTISVACGFLNVSGLCAARPVQITIQPVTGSGSAPVITQFRVSSMSGATYASGLPTPASSLTFTVNPLGLLGTAQFTLGMDVSLPAGSSGTQTFNFTVVAAFL